MINFRYAATLTKAGDEVDGRIPITIQANHPSRDRQNDLILSDAFDDDCRREFLHDGVIDYDHISMLGETPDVRAMAIIGQPEDFYLKENIPICEGFLFRGNPYVDNTILPALKAQSKVFGASVGGKILKKSLYVDPLSKAKGNDVGKVRLKHIAITPLQKAVHQNTSVTLRKSESGEEEYFFNDFDDLLKSIQSTEFLNKALTAGASTGIAGMTGGQVLQSQSLEGVGKKRKRDLAMVIPFAIQDVQNGYVRGNSNDFKSYFMRKGLTEDEAKELTVLVATNSHKIVKSCPEFVDS